MTTIDKKASDILLAKLCAQFAYEVTGDPDAYKQMPAVMRSQCKDTVSSCLQAIFNAGVEQEMIAALQAAYAMRNKSKQN